MTIFSPYVYNWGLGNSVYKIDGMVKAQKELKHNYFTSAFIIGDGYGGLNSNVTNSLSDL